MNIGIDSARQYADVLDIRTAYYRKGKGPTIVLLHGSSPGACSELNWFRVFDALAAQGYDVVAFDQPGFGHSEAPTDHSIEFRYRHAAAFLDSQGIDTAVLVGNSMGGLIAVLLEQRLPRRQLRVDGLVLVAQFPHFPMREEVLAKQQAHRARLGSVVPTFEGVQKLCQNTFFDAKLVSEEIVRLRLSMLAGGNWSAAQARAAMEDVFDAGSIRSVVDVRTLIIWGQNDRSLPREIGIQALEHFSHADLLLLPRCGHWPQTECTTAFLHAMRGFLSEIRSRQTSSLPGEAAEAVSL